MAEGITFSDLHLFSPQCRADQVLPAIWERLPHVQCLVLNGDIFDLEWTYHATMGDAADAALAWLEDLRNRFPHLEIHYVLGNHDCQKPFIERLGPWAESVPDFHCHDSFVRLGSAVFLHGDCTTWPMTPSGFAAYRRKCAAARLKPAWKRRLLNGAHEIGLIPLVHRAVFPRPIVVRRLTRFLRAVEPDLLDGVTDVYFGHTHLPFSGHRAGLLSFHNCGSPIGPLGFQPLRFQVVTEKENGHGTVHAEAPSDLAKEWS
jgi:hypothetical protein